VSGGAKRGGGLLRWLKPLLGLLILAFVFWKFVPLHDELLWTRTVGEETRTVTVRGELLSDWNGDRTRFQPDAGYAPGPAAPPVLRDWTGGPVELLRGEAAAAAGVAEDYDWRPRMQRVFAGLEARWLAAAMALFFLGNFIVITRWWRLLRAVGCVTSWWNTFRLNFLGFFFNAVVPGLTGGDLVKAVLVVREHPGRRADALVSVIVDRVIGLVSMAALAGAVILLAGDTFAELKLWVTLMLAAMAVGAAVYFNHGLRRLVRFDELLGRLPMGDKLKLLDEAALLYRDHKGELAFATFLSFFNHLAYIGGTACLGVGLGVTLEMVGPTDYLAIVPVVNIISALPLAPGGWGVGEVAYVSMFKLIGADATLGVAISLTFRFCQLALGLFGGTFLLMPGARAELESAEAQAEAST